MKKIKHMRFVVLLTLICTAMCSCHDNVDVAIEPDIDYVALEVGGFDASDGGIHSSEYPLWSENQVNSHIDDTAPEETTVSFNGEIHSGTYLRSVTRAPNLYKSHRYKSQNVYFEINANTNELVSYMRACEPQKEATLEEAECKQIADSIAEGYIDLNRYETEITVKPIYNNYIYIFEYYREINEIPTNDRLIISIDGNGNISSFDTSMLHSFDNVNSVKLDKDKMMSAIESKIGDIYQTSKNRKGYEIDSIRLVKLEDDATAFFCIINNEFFDENIQYNSMVSILVKSVTASE